jgi:hypothetical protein
MKVSPLEPPERQQAFEPRKRARTVWRFWLFAAQYFWLRSISGVAVSLALQSIQRRSLSDGIDSCSFDSSELEFLRDRRLSHPCLRCLIR